VGLRTESIRSGLAMLLGIAMRPAMGLRISQAENGTLVFRTSQARSTGSQPPASLVSREPVCEAQTSVLSSSAPGRGRLVDGRGASHSICQCRQRGRPAAACNSPISRGFAVAAALGWDPGRCANRRRPALLTPHEPRRQ